MNEINYEHLYPSVVEALENQEGKKEIDFTKLQKGDKIIFKTKNSTYKATIENPNNGEVWLQGGEKYPFLCKVIVAGSTFGGSIIKMGHICEDMCVEIIENGIGWRPITTTRVQSVEVIKKDENEQNK